MAYNGLAEPGVQLLGNIRDLQIVEGPYHGPQGAPLGVVYVAGGHGRVHQVVKFPVSELPNATKKPADVISEILAQAPPETNRALVLGGTVLSLCLLDADHDIRTNELDRRWLQSAAFLIRADEREVVPVKQPDIQQFDPRTGVGPLYPRASGALLLAHSLLLPNPHPEDVGAAVRLTESDGGPIYGAIHQQVPEMVVRRGEL